VKKEDAVRIAKESGVKLVVFAYCDSANLIRGKATHVNHLERRLDSGIGLTVGQQAATDLDLLAEIEGMGPAGEARIFPDLASMDTLVPLPWAPSRAMIMGDLLKLDMTPWACPRTFLKQQIAKAEARGLNMQVGLEPEWYVGRYDPETDYYKPIENSQSFHMTGYTHYTDFIDDLLANLETLGMDVETFYPESGPGHLEVTVRPEGALRAADNHIFYREAVRNTAFAHDLAATFMPKPFLDQAGAGGHIHVSATDSAGKTNLFYGKEGPYSLSEIGSHFLAGVVEHLPGLMALISPSVNSYRRFHEGSWSGGEYLTYGSDNRESPIRIPSQYKGNEMGSANLEIKPADNSANPYIAIGGIIAAGLDGIDRELRPRPSQFADLNPALLTRAERAERGITRLPATLPDAIEALERDEILVDAMGPQLGQPFVTLRKFEEGHFAAHDLAFELRRHYNKY
jgi:glutamine synthetase